MIAVPGRTTMIYVRGRRTANHKAKNLPGGEAWSSSDQGLQGAVMPALQVPLLPNKNCYDKYRNHKNGDLHPFSTPRPTRYSGLVAFLRCLAFIRFLFLHFCFSIP